MYWAVGQLFSYSLLQWLAFLTVAIVCAWVLNAPGIILGHFIIAIVVTAFDVQWIQAEMRKPGWNGEPDQDFVFMFGVAARIILINTALLPVSCFTSWLNRHRKLRRAIRRTHSVAPMDPRSPVREHSS